MLCSSNDQNVTNCLTTFTSGLSPHLHEFTANRLGFELIKNIVLIFSVIDALSAQTLKIAQDVLHLLQEIQNTWKYRSVPTFY
jgi:hypothetical protein